MSEAIYVVLLISQKDYELFHATKLDSGFSYLEALSTKSEALNKSKPQMTKDSKHRPKARRFSP